jgi:hypothetical protein
MSIIALIRLRVSLDRMVDGISSAMDTRITIRWMPLVSKSFLMDLDTLTILTKKIAAIAVMLNKVVES